MKANFLFTALHESPEHQTSKTSRDPFGLEILRKISERLCEEGFTVTKPNPGKGCDAAFKVTFDGFAIGAAARVVKRNPDTIECALITLCSRPRSSPAPDRAISDGWNRISKAIAGILRDDPNIVSLQLLTEQEATAHDSFR